MPNIAAFERARVARMQAKLDRLTRAHYQDPARRTLIVGHQEYDVVWDGSFPPHETVTAETVTADRPCACGCGLLVTPPVRYASQACVGRGFRGRSVTERTR